MADQPVKLPLLAQRELEARIVGPLVRAFADEIGDERALEIVRGVIARLACQAGDDLANRLGDRSLEAFVSALGSWSEGGALELKILEQSSDRLSFNVTRCRYAEMYRALGLQDLGASLSCSRDLHLIAGFNPGITLERTQTIMEGAEFCDFRFHNRAPAEP